MCNLWGVKTVKGNEMNICLVRINEGQRPSYYAATHQEEDVRCVVLEDEPAAENGATLRR